MNAVTPKQFLLLAGKPMLMHCISAFDEAFPGIGIIIALPEGHMDHWQDLCTQYDFKLPHTVVAGGETRFHSVKNALSHIMDEEDGVVAIHDGARPLVSASLISQVFLTASSLGNCIPVIALNESLRQIDGVASRAANRDDFRIVQTPQAFHSPIIRKAYKQKYRESFTDDAMVVEHLGEKIHLADGDPVNIKITRPCDLVTAEALLAAR
jgi:2-C-methyl-D-erythritol 4-phosphate cytidylyltransferase